MRRQRVLSLVLVLPVLALAACTGGGAQRTADPTPPSSSPTTAAHRLVGTYDVTSVVDRTTLTGRGNTRGTKDRLALVVGCADDTCERLLVRGSVSSGALSRTVALRAGDTVATGERRRTGPCTQTANGSRPGRFTETARYRLVEDGEALSGGVAYAFRGCGFDGTSHLALRGRRTADVPSYLPKEAVATLAEPVTAYDEAVRTLYAGYNGCYNRPPGRTAACLVGLLQPWSGTFGPTEAALAAASGGGPVCTRALAAVALAPLQRKVGATVRALRRPGSQREALDRAVPQLVTVLTTTHRDLVSALAVCVDPRDTASFGADGVLALDVDRRLPVPSS